jgi:hypothetical protein
MAPPSPLLLSLSVFLAVLIHASSASTASYCASRGYAIGQVACAAVCGEIAKALSSTSSSSSSPDPAVADCYACCSPSLDLALPKRFPSAVLTINRMNLGSFGGVNEWMEKSLSKWDAQGRGQVQVVESFAVAAPILSFLEDGDDAASASASSSSSSSSKKGKSGGKSAAAARAADSAAAVSRGMGGGGGVGGIHVPVGSWKIEHIDALLAKKLEREE